MKKDKGKRPFGRFISLLMMIVAAAAMSVCFAAAAFSVEASGTEFRNTKAEAAADLREGMKQRKSTVTVGVLGSTDQDGLKQMISELIVMATEHTGDPCEGDYLKFQYSTYKGVARTTVEGTVPAIEITYTLEYNDDTAMEEEVDLKVDEILESLDLDGKSDYEKLTAIYEYLVGNIEYDTESEGSLKRTAYGALINGEAVCQGYSLALYRLLLEAGIDNRIIYGKGIMKDGTTGSHTWNVVDLYGDHYYVDLTWDDTTNTRDHFLIPAGTDFDDSHIPDGEYGSDFFTKEYPVTTEEFRGDLPGQAEKIFMLASGLPEAIREAADKSDGE